MANLDTLIITYKPARQKISFDILENNNVVQKNYDEFEKYATKKDFVLNLQGAEFFEDILHPFAGRENVTIKMLTTRLDYEEFKNKVEDFNSKQNSKLPHINLEKLEEKQELLDMKTAFKEIKTQSLKIESILEKYWSDIKNISCKSTTAREYVDKIAEKIKREKDNISKKIKSLSEDNNVNICLIGTYSSGKSTLVNTFLGYKILPVDIGEATAKMIKIKGAKKIEDSSICFYIGEGEFQKVCTLVWNIGEKRLYIKDSNFEKEEQEIIHNKIEEHKNKRLDEQFFEMLNFINAKKEYNAQVDLTFPILLNKEDLQFTIYDTPGADGNIGAHKLVLNKALQEQSNSILLFVFKPDSLTGSGNREILTDFLEKNTNSKIDIEQSFFVINKADANANELDKIKNQDLLKYEGDTNPIHLAEKKVFFISAKRGFSAIACKNKIETKEDVSNLKEYAITVCDDNKTGLYYQHNHYGKSEFATRYFKEKSDNAFKDAKLIEDNNELFYIASGFYSLAQGIQEYGEKYASSVKVAAILQSIENAVKAIMLIKKDTSLGNGSSVEDVQDKLETEIEKINEIIEEISQKYKNEAFAANSTKELGVDSDSFLNEIIEPVREKLENKLKKKFCIVGKVVVTADLQKNVLAEVQEITNKYVKKYKNKRTEYLQKKLENFIQDFFEKIDDGEISKETKMRLQQFKSPEIPAFKLNEKIDELFDGANIYEHSLAKKALKWIKNAEEKQNEENEKEEKQASTPFFNKIADTAKEKTVEILIELSNWQEKTVKKENFIEDVLAYLHDMENKIVNGFRADFGSSLQQMCDVASDEFKDNIEIYSSKIRALQEDSEPLEEVAKYMNELDEKICKEKNELEENL